MRRSTRLAPLFAPLAVVLFVVSLSLTLASSDSIRRAVTGADSAGSPFAPAPSRLRLDFPELRASDSDAVDASICLHETR
ncbi:MAG: hypothetical protein AAF488_11485 [Planctomycetota bacterium]